MNAFELFCYIVAIVSILGFFGEPRTTTEETTAPATPEPEPTPEPATVTPATDLQALTVAELRRRATQARYPWRNAHGPNRHSTKRELIAALS